MLEPMKSRTAIQTLAHVVLIVLCTVMGSGVFAAAVADKRTEQPSIKFIAEPAPLKKIVAPPTAAPVAKGEGELMYTSVSKGYQAPSAAAPVVTELGAERISPSNRRTVWMEVTAYCPCKKCCGRNARGITASGKRVNYNGGKFVAADTSHFPFGTRLSIPGYHSGRPVEVIDTGSAIKGRKLDVYFPSHETATEWGVKMVPVTVYREE
jgi:3D (Asp-Asp-Asp) domain-containing protein